MKKHFIIFIFVVLLHFPISLAQTYKDVLINLAEDGDLGAQKYLAEAYYEGKGVYPKNLLTSFKWLKRAASQGDAESQFRLYSYMRDGIGCEKSVDLELLIKSAEQKYPKALLELGRVYSQLSGKVCEGRKLLIEAYNLGEIEALADIATNYAVECDYSNAYIFYRKASVECISEGRAKAYFGLSLMYRYGLGVEKNIRTAHEMINQAINNDPKDPRYYDFKGCIFLEEGKITEASKMWNKLIDVNVLYAMETKSDLARAMNNSVDYGIPVSCKTNYDTFALIIANENYKHVPNVPFSINDGQVFQKYVTSTLGVPEANVQYLEDATLNDIKYALKILEQKCKTLGNQKNVIVYYSGHGIPDDKASASYLLPIDGFGDDLSTGLKLDGFYETLATMSAKIVLLFIDACFSGANKDGGMLMATRGITIKAKSNVPEVGNLIVFSATSEDQSAFPINEQSHGLFTYMLLRKIQDTGGNVSLGELADYVRETVKAKSINDIGKPQSPTISVSSSLKDSWRSIRLIQ